MPRSLHEHIAKTDELPTDLLLGHLAVSTIQDLAYPRDQLVKLFESLGLDTGLVPELSTPVNAFYKATNAYSRAASRKDCTYEMPNGSLGILRTEEVTSPSPREIIIRTIVRKEQKQNRPALDFTRVGEIRLYRPARRGRNGKTEAKSARLLTMVNKEGLARYEQKQVAAFLGRLEEEYTRQCTSLNGDAMRHMLMNYVRGPLQGVAIKPAVTFIPIRHAEHLKRLTEAIKHIEGTQLDLIPMVDLGDQRDIIVRAAQEATEVELTGLAARLREASASPASLVRMREQYDALTARTATYREMLGEAIERTSTASDIVQALLRNLAKKVFEMKE